MMRTMQVEWLKLKRTPIKWVVFTLPTLFSVGMIWYISLVDRLSENEVFIFQGFFEIWSAIFVPFGAGLLTGLMTQQEESAGGFQGLLSTKVSRSKLFLGKLAMLVFLSAVSLWIATGTLIIGLTIVLEVPISIPSFLWAAFVTQICTASILAMHLWISFAWGMGPTIGIGGAGVLLGGLMATTLGNHIWKFIPWGWPVRTSMLAGSVLVDPTIPTVMIATELLIGIFPAVLFLIIMAVGGILWFKRWEGRKVFD